jgi:hypothetical protein
MQQEIIIKHNIKANSNKYLYVLIIHLIHATIQQD